MRRFLLPTAAAFACGLLAGSLSAQLTASGRVTRDGTGVPGVQVQLFAQTNSYRFYGLLDTGKFFPEPVDVVTTRADGSFDVRAPEPGMWHLHVAARGYRPMEFNFWPLLETRRVPDLELVAETPVRVRVADSEGQPFHNALVRASAPPRPERRRMRREYWRPAYRQAFTNADGMAQVGRGADEAVDIYAWAPGHYEAERTSVRTRGADLQLVPGIARSLRVLTPKGAAVESVLVRVAERRWPAGWTDDEGGVSVALGEEDTLKLHVLAADGRRIEKYVQAADWPSDGPLEITLEPRPLYSGRLVDAERQNGIGGAFVWLAGRPVDFVRSDATGGYEIEIESGSRGWLWGAAPGYLNSAAQLGSEGSGPAIELRPTIQLSGVVIDEAGNPISGAEVGASVDMAAGGRRTWEASAWLTPAVTDPAGRFTLSRLDAGVAYMVRAAHPGFAPTELPLANPRTEARNGLELVLEAGRTLVGSVVDQGGLSIAGARVEVKKTVNPNNVRRYMLERSLGSKEPIASFTDEEGRFAVSDLPAGLFEVEISASGHASEELGILEITETTAELDVGEVALGPGFTIEGRVTDRNGSPLEGAKVFASDGVQNARIFVSRIESESPPAMVTDVNGFFSVVDRAEGDKVDLRVEMTGYAENTVRGVTAPTYQPVSIELERASTVRGVVVDAGGAGIADAVVSVQVTRTMGLASSSMSNARASSDGDGRFVIENVNPGELELQVRAEGYVQARIDSLTVEPGRDLDGVRAVLERGATVSGRIRGPSGRPVSGAQVLSMEGRSGFRQTFHGAATSDGEGRYRLDGIPPGSRAITVNHDNHKQMNRTIEVEPGDNVFDISLEGGVTFSGRVVDTAGSPIATADLSLHATSYNFLGNSQGITDSEGQFSLDGLGEGIYSLQVTKEGFASSSLENIEIGPAGLSGYEVRLETGAAIVGRILGLESERVGDVQIYAARPPRGFSPGRANRDGTYRIEDLAPGDYSVVAQLGASGLTASGHTTVSTGVPETVLDLEFEQGLTLTGVVLRRAEPVTGAPVTVSGVDIGASSGGMTDSEGRFEVSGLKPGRYHLSVQNYQTGLNHQEEIEVRVDQDVTIRIATAEVTGWVRDASDSRPITNATVQLESLEPSPNQHTWFNASAITDSAGFFRFSEASAGSYRALVQKDGYGPGESAVTVADGSDQPGIEILLTPTDGLRVYVTLADGQLAGSFVATVFDTAGNRVTYGSYSSEGDGGTVLSLAEGTWDLVIGTGSTAVADVRVTVPSQPVTVTLQPEARLSVRIPELDGDPALGTVKIFDSQGRPFRGMMWINSLNQWPMAQGRTTVTGLSPGSWSVHATTPDGRAWQGQVQLGAGDNPELVLN